MERGQTLYATHAARAEISPYSCSPLLAEEHPAADMPRHQSLSAPAGSSEICEQRLCRQRDVCLTGSCKCSCATRTCSIFVKLRESVLLIHWRRSFLLTKYASAILLYLWQMIGSRHSRCNGLLPHSGSTHFGRIYITRCRTSTEPQSAWQHSPETHTHPRSKVRGLQCLNDGLDLPATLLLLAPKATLMERVAQCPLGFQPCDCRCALAAL